jgi:alkanesulfonate monooxygenase SsuD/methylene tetrahydromethanopterin reductase-like flavin-dependent oxidoreductase (luciferase family)
MDTGIGYFATHDAVGRGEMARMAEEHGHAAFYFAEHTHIPGGRVEFGVGAGWNREEMPNHGTDPHTRMKLLAERVDAMKAIWTQEEASYHGRFVDFDARGKVLERIPEVRERGIPVTVISVPADAAALEKLQEAGVERVAPWLPSAGRSRVEAALERFEAAVAELNGE